jgi:uncharacterized protein (DUF2267 family)
MSPSSVPAFDSTMQTTNVWLHDIMDRLGWRERARAYHALRAVLHALRDRLQVEQAAALGAQLPMLIRGIYYEGWHPHGKPLKERKKDEFLAHIAHDLRGTLEGEPETIARTVFQVLAKHVTPGEVQHVKLAMPRELRDLWSPESHTLCFHP